MLVRNERENGDNMLTHEKIAKAVEKISIHYPVKSVAYFGSYADGNQTEGSDLDLLVEFDKGEKISLYTVIGFKQDMEDEVGAKVDVVEMPIAERSYIEIERAVHVYGEEKQDYTRKITI